MEHPPLQALLRKMRARRGAARGFTLIEMLVVIFIITVVTSVLLIGEANFNNTLFLTNTTYSIASSIRLAASSGLSSKGYVSGGTTYKNVGYGVHFDTGSATSYVEFADINNSELTGTQNWCPTGTTGQPDAKPGDCVYNGSGEKIVQYNLNQGMKILDYCAYSGGSTPTLIGCATSNGSTLNALDIEFVRPNMDAVITGSNGLFTFNWVKQATLACIKIGAPNNSYRYIQINQLGEIGVTTSCP